MKPLYHLLHDDFDFHCKEELQTLCQEIQTSNTKDVTLTLNNTNHSFFFTADSPWLV